MYYYRTPEGDSLTQTEEILRANLARLISPDFWGVAMTESIGGNAGRGCLAVNLVVDVDGRVLKMGNDSSQINATLRMYLPFPPKPGMKLREIIIDVVGTLIEGAKERLQKSAWLWNLYQLGPDKALLKDFADGRMSEDELDEMLGSKYPGLA